MRIATFIAATAATSALAADADPAQTTTTSQISPWPNVRHGHLKAVYYGVRITDDHFQHGPVITDAYPAQSETSSTGPHVPNSPTPVLLRREVPMEKDASGFYFDKDADWSWDYLDEDCTCDPSSATPTPTATATATSAASAATTTPVTIARRDDTRHKEAHENLSSETSAATENSSTTENTPTPTPSPTTSEKNNTTPSSTLPYFTSPSQRIGRHDWPNGKIITPTHCEDWKKEYCNPMIPASVTLAAMVSSLREHIKTRGIPTSTASFEL